MGIYANQNAVMDNYKKKYFKDKCKFTRILNPDNHTILMFN